MHFLIFDIITVSLVMRYYYLSNVSCEDKLVINFNDASKKHLVNCVNCIASENNDKRYCIYFPILILSIINNQNNYLSYHYR